MDLLSDMSGRVFMRKLVIGAALLGSLAMSQSALADHRFSQFGYGHGNFNNRGFDRRWNHRSDHRFNQGFYGARANSYHYGSFSNRGRNNFVSVSYGNRFNQFGHRGWNGGDFVGGLVVGSLLSNSYSQPRVTERVIYRSAPVSQEVVYVNQQPRTINTAPRRKLLRDLQGNCYQIDFTANGDEIRTELPPQDCSF
jgi:hypothetical protein